MKLDITPSPRVLRMLGEIDFKAWQCLCELVDNSIDAFVAKQGNTQIISDPRIEIRLSSNSFSNLKATDSLEVRDNGKGMTLEDLQWSIKAGFTANNPVEKMGLFGMGFNIATARLGNRTEVITATEDSEHLLKVTIDFQELEKTGHFQAPLEIVPKDPSDIKWHGTVVKITKLRVNHLQTLFKKKTVLEKLGKIYGRILISRQITLIYLGGPCRPFKHCIWSAQRNGQNKDGPVPAIIEINHLFDTKRYCPTCWVWVSDVEPSCSACNNSNSLVKRERRVKGWIGIQRYFDDTHYGIDLIRNGRVIRELDKTFFYWDNPTSSEPELEYPIDGHERKGRIVGELEIDFVKVTHQKDAFDTSSSDWRDVVRLVRGDGPIRPQIAKENGYSENTSPLARLFSAFRTAKGGIRNLVPQRGNGSAMITDAVIDELVLKYNQGEHEYQSDEKWWLLLGENNVASIRKNDSLTLHSGGNPFFESLENHENLGLPIVCNDPTSNRKDGLVVESEPIHHPDTELSQTYSLEIFKNIAIRVNAWKEITGSTESGFSVSLRGSEMEFRYWPNSKFFSSTLIKPSDALVNELAYHFHTISQNELSKTPITLIELSIRKKYFKSTYPDLDSLENQVEIFVADLSQHLLAAAKQSNQSPSRLLNENLIQLIRTKIARSEYKNSSEINKAISEWNFLPYVTLEMLATIIHQCPQFVFDGRFFSHVWESNAPVLLPNSTLLNELRIILDDIAWFFDNKGNNLSNLWQSKIKRVIAAVEILNLWRA
jgi:hypothetical protein